MVYNFGVSSLLSLFSFLVVFYVFLDHLIRSRKTEVNTNFSLLLLAMLAWNFGSIFETSASNDTALSFWKEFGYIGFTFVGVLWLTFALKMTTGVDHIRLFHATFFILLGPSLVSLAALFTNGTHHLFFREIGLKSLTFGPFFYLDAFFFFLYMIVGAMLHLIHFLQHRQWYYRRQSVYMIAGSFFPVIAYALYTLRAYGPTYDITPITFSISAMTFFLLIHRYGPFDIIPIAHSQMVKSMGDGVIVLDRGGTIIEINQTALQVLGIGEVSPIGKSYKVLLGPDANEKVRRILGIIRKAPATFLDVFDTLESFSNVTLNVSVSSIRGDNNQIIGRLATIRDVTERVNVERQLHELSIRDDLTNLYNQRYFYRLLNREVHRADRQGYALSLLVLDIDNFKEYNDRFGHIEGNRALARVGELILENIRYGVDSAFRFGGDEFIAVLPEVDVEQASQVGERIRSSFEICGIGNLTLSLGIAEYKQQCNIDNLFEMADQAMYHAKRNGRNRLHVVRAATPE